MSAELLRIVRNYLDITWDDPSGDEKLGLIIQRGMRYIDGIAGREMDYMEPGAAQGLLLSYCRYERSGALNDFQTDYLHELLSLQLSNGGDDVETPVVEPSGEPEQAESGSATNI